MVSIIHWKDYFPILFTYAILLHVWSGTWARCLLPACNTNDQPTLAESSLIYISYSGTSSVSLQESASCSRQAIKILGNMSVWPGLDTTQVGILDVLFKFKFWVNSCWIVQKSSEQWTSKSPYNQVIALLISWPCHAGGEKQKPGQEHLGRDPGVEAGSQVQ